MYIYAYELVFYPNLIKIGQTERDVKTRIKEQLSILPNSDNLFKVVYTVYDKKLNVNISDKEVHKALKKYHVNGEWFNCSVEVLDKVIHKIAIDKINKGEVYKDKEHDKRYNIKHIIIQDKVYTYVSEKNLCKQLKISYNSLTTYIHRTKATLEQAILYYINKKYTIKINNEIYKYNYKTELCNQVGIKINTLYVTMSRYNLTFEQAVCRLLKNKIGRGTGV